MSLHSKGPLVLLLVASASHSHCLPEKQQTAQTCRPLWDMRQAVLGQSEGPRDLGSLPGCWVQFP